MRMSYQRQKEVLEMPNLIEVQKDSYQWFLDEGLKEVFDDISPIADYGGKLSLEFIDFTYDEKDAKYSIEQCKERDVTYAAPLKVRVRLINKETEEINEHEIFMGDLPLMTATGTFVINGAERVIVSQLVRSPGIYYAIAHDKLGKRLFSSTVIPNRGAWLEYETDSNDVFYVRVDRTRKVPITVLIRALGIGTNAEIIDLFGEEPKILASFTKDTSTNYQEGLLELYKKIRPGEPLAVESAESLIMAMFFDPRRYDLAKVGRYKFNKKLAISARIKGKTLAEPVADPRTGEIIANEGDAISADLAMQIERAGVNQVELLVEGKKVRVFSNNMVYLDEYVDFEVEDFPVKKVRKAIIEEISDYTEELIREIKAGTQTFRHDNLTNKKCPQCGKRLLAVNGKNSKMLVCQDRECGYRETLSRTSNARCPKCHKKMELYGKGEDQTFICKCGYKEKLSAFKNRREKEGAGVSKRDVQSYLKKQQKEAAEPLNNAFAAAFAKLDIK